jgi:hypothetical protein
VIRFIDEHQDRRSGQLRWGIEPIAKVLGIAPSTYHAAKKRPPSARAVRDGELEALILRIWEENLAVYGADKIWDQVGGSTLITSAPRSASTAPAAGTNVHAATSRTRTPSNGLPML